MITLQVISEGPGFYDIPTLIGKQRNSNKYKNSPSFSMGKEIKKCSVPIEVILNTEIIKQKKFFRFI